MTIARRLLGSFFFIGFLAGCGQGTPAPQTTPSAPPAPAESPARVEAPEDGPTVSPADFEPVTGDGWQGELVYAASEPGGEDQTVPAELAVSQDGRTLTLSFSFPDSPQGDGSAELEISEDGAWINDELVTRREMEDGVLTLLTRQECIEGRYIATCEYLYDISADEFSIAKAVTLAGEDAQRFAHHYRFTR